eukprot:7723642-Pyramimonas_sp.AAC.1
MNTIILLRCCYSNTALRLYYFPTTYYYAGATLLLLYAKAHIVHYYRSTPNLLTPWGYRSTPSAFLSCECVRLLLYYDSIATALPLLYYRF